MSTFVLVPGGGHGGWCYSPVARILRAAGHEVFAPTLTGVGERAHAVHPAVDLETHITDITSLLFFEDLRDVVLVGHSYGGMVISGAADRAADRVGRVVFLDAAVPSSGESLADRAPAMMDYAASSLRVVDGVELVLWPDEKLVAVLGVSDPRLQPWVRERLTPHPWKCFTQRLMLRDEAALRRIPSFHVVCASRLAAQDSVLINEARSGGRLWVVDTGHDLMLTQPVDVANALLEVAAHSSGDRTR